jgi:uncharacterized protein YkwD
MKRSEGLLRVTLLPLAAVLLATAAPPPAAAATVTQRDAAEKRMVARLNTVRANHDLGKLHVAARLTKAATRHANQMASRGYFRHDMRKNGSWVPFGTWIRSYWPGPGYTAWSAGENIAWASPDATAREFVRLWMASSGHRANILGRWGSIGAAIVHVVNPTGVYADHHEVTIAVTDFGRRSG